MAKRPLPTPAELRQLLRYEPETGALYWLEREPRWFGREQDCKRWNTCFAGKTTGTVMPIGYLCFSLLGHTILAHRAAWALTHGEWPQGDIDHINGNPADNRLENLRAVSHRLNQRNMRRNSNNTTGVTGVQMMPSGKFRAVIGGKVAERHLGYFETIEQASAARKEAETARGYHINHGSDR